VPILWERRLPFSQKKKFHVFMTMRRRKSASGKTKSKAENRRKSRFVRSRWRGGRYRVFEDRQLWTV
jgi:hypothetical protein